MREGKVYFVEAPGRIKIGFTFQPEKRLASLRSRDMEKLEVIGIIPATRFAEKKLHEMLDQHRFPRSEWFKDCPDVRKVVDDALAGKIDFNGQPEERSLLPYEHKEPVDLDLFHAAVRRCYALAEQGLLYQKIEKPHDVKAMVEELGDLTLKIIVPAIKRRPDLRKYVDGTA